MIRVREQQQNQDKDINLTERNHNQAIIATESWQANTQLLIHLLRFSNLLLVVLGEPGSGKSTLKQYFAEQAAGDFLVRELDVDSVGHPTELPAQISSQFGLMDDSIRTLSERIQSLQQQLAQQQKTAVLLIDDVDSWSPEIVATLFECVSANSKGAGLHCLIFGDNERLRRILCSSHIEKYLDNSAHLLTLDPLSKEEIKDFINQYCRLQRINVQELYDSISLDSIAAQSKGYPSAILQLLAQHASYETEETTEITMNDTTSTTQAVAGRLTEVVRKLPIHWAVGLGACAILLASVSVSLFLEQPGKPKQAQAQVQQTTAERLQALRLPEQDRQDKTEQLALLSNDTFSETTIGSSRQQAHPITITKSKPVAKPVVQAEPVKSVQQAPVIEQAPAKVVKKVAPVKTNVIAKKNDAAQKKPAITAQTKRSTTEQKLLAMNGKHFTLQLLGVSKEQSLEAFIKANKLSDEPMTAHTKRNGKDWYVLLYGDFASHQDALREVKKLPKALQDLKPWPRRVAEVQSSIEKQVN